jgi:fructokinase
MQPVIFGEILWDLLPTGKVLGGAPANAAYRLKTLGISPILISAVGDDLLGRELIKGIKEKGVETNYIQKVQNVPTGSVQITLNNEGNPRYSIEPNVAYDFISLNEESKKVIKSADFFLFGTLAQRGSKSRETLYTLLDLLPESAEVFLDVNLRTNCYDTLTIIDSIKLAHYIKLNHSEARILSDMFGLKVGDDESILFGLLEKFQGLHGALLTLGEDGVRAATRGSTQSFTVKALPIKVVDTIGAGDAFTAGFIAGKLSGLDFASSISLGNIVGACAASSSGGMAIPDAKLHEEALSLLQKTFKEKEKAC